MILTPTGARAYSDRNEVTGFANAARTACTLTVINVTPNAAKADPIKTPGPILIR